jgi:hypothetical protein
MKHLVWLILLFVALGVLVYLSSDDSDRAGLIGGSTGYITSGSKFGISIGMPLATARLRLAGRGLQPLDLASLHAPPHRCLGWAYPPDHTVEAWTDDSWRRGTICIASVHGAVASVRWHFNSLELP